MAIKGILTIKSFIDLLKTLCDRLTNSAIWPCFVLRRENYFESVVCKDPHQNRDVLKIQKETGSEKASYWLTRNFKWLLCTLQLHRINRFDHILLFGRGPVTLAYFGTVLLDCNSTTYGVDLGSCAYTQWQAICIPRTNSYSMWARVVMTFPWPVFMTSSWGPLKEHQTSDKVFQQRHMKTVIYIKILYELFLNVEILLLHRLSELVFLQYLGSSKI